MRKIGCVATQSGPRYDFSYAHHWGRLTRVGWSVPQCHAEAMNWSLTAAKQGNPSAQTILGTIYDSGYGVPQNFVHGHSLHWADFVSPIELASVRSSTKRMAIGRPATAPPMPVLKCSGVQRSSAASTASRYVSRTFSGAPRLE